MAHEIETMMYFGQTPWHGLGVQLDAPPTSAEALTAAGLDWEVGTKNLQIVETGAKVSHRAVVRLSDNTTLGVVGPEWTPYQNRDKFALIDPLVVDGSVTLETAGSLRNGRRVWLLARVAVDPVEIVPGDPILRYILLSNAHDGSQSARIGFTDTRVVCANTMAIAHNDSASKLIRVRHTPGIVENMEAIRDTMNMAARDFQANCEQFRNLASRDINAADLEKYVKRVFRMKSETPETEEPAADDTSGERLVGRIVPLFESGRGNAMPGVRGTWWAAYNAVSEYLSHERGRTADTRVDSLWFGQGATLNKRALTMALDMSASQ